MPNPDREKNEIKSCGSTLNDTDNILLVQQQINGNTGG